jgi:hypothetical protein
MDSPQCRCGSQTVGGAPDESHLTRRAQARWVTMTAVSKPKKETVLKRFSLAIFFFAFGLRAVVAWKAGFFRNFQRDEMVRIALSLVRYHEYGNPYLIRTGPTAHEMPLYPVFLSLLYLVFGTGAAAEAVKILLACAATALRCALLPRFCMAAGLGRAVGIISGILGTVYISALQTELRGNWDGPWQALALLILIWMTIRIWSEHSWLQRTPRLYLILWGVAILLQPAFSPILAVFLLSGLIAVSASARRRYLQQSMALLLVVFTFLAPWTIRNYIRFGKLIATRSNFGLELWLSNGPGRAFDMQTNLGFDVPHPSLNLREAQLVLQMGEVRYNQMKIREAEAWIRSNPGEFAHLTLLRVLAWWFPPGRNAFHRAAGLGLSVLALIGLGLMFRIQPLVATLFLLTWISFPLVYYMIQWSSKYRYAMEWELLVCAALTIGSVLKALSPAVSDTRSAKWPTRLAHSLSHLLRRAGVAASPSWTAPLSRSS